MARFERNKLISTIPSWGPLFRINFDVYLDSLGSGWQSLLAFKGNNAASNIGEFGDRVPIIELNDGKLYFLTAINGNPNFHFTPRGVQVGKWYKIIIEQNLVNGKVRYILSINSQL